MFPTHDETTAPDGSRELLEALKGQLGFIPNLAGSMANSPALLGAFLGARSSYEAASLSPDLRELVALAVAVECQARYPIAAHSTFALAAGADADDIAHIRAGRSPSSPCASVLVETARQIFRSHGRVASDVVVRFVEAGFNPSQLLEVAAGVGMTELAAMAYHLTLPAIDAPLASQAPA